MPRIIVLHWTAIDDLEASFRAFDRETLAGRPDLDSAGHVNVSIQFLVDRDGTIYRLMPETHMARHVIGLNYSAIGVENVGGAGGVDNLTDAQIKANVRLVRYLAKKYSTIQQLIGHISNIACWNGVRCSSNGSGAIAPPRSTLGDRFMGAVRAGVADLKLRADGAPGAATPGQR